MSAPWLPLGGEALAYVVVLARLLPFAVIAPWLGGRFVPVPVRVGLALVLAGVLLPGLPHASGELAGLGLARAVLTESLLGVALGFVTALTVYAAAMAGALIDAARGQRDPLLGDLLGAGAAGPTATLLVLATVAIFLSVDGHHVLLGALRATYEVAPAGGIVPTVAAMEPGALLLVGLMGQMVALAVAVSLPVLLSGLLAALALGLAGRMTPRLHAFFLVLPLQSLLGLLVLLVGLGVALEVLVGTLGESGGWLGRLVGGLEAR
jgi:flagellar biosynthesis protein FliR